MSTDTTVENTTEAKSFTEALLGKEVVNAPMLSRFRAWPAEFRTTLSTMLLGMLVLVPYLGSVGLWDPWEGHYGEVAREMIQRNDYVHPFWENAWFFSKPAFTMWMQALGMQGAAGGPALAGIVGVLLLAAAGYLWFKVSNRGENPVAEFQASLLAVPGALALVLALFGFGQRLQWRFADAAGGDGAIPLFNEWGFRLPFASFAILAASLLTYALSRTVSPRAGMATGLVLLTMPLYFLEARQAITDMPIVAATVAGIACAIVGLYDNETKHRSEWWYASWVFFAIATLAKELLGFGVPMVVFLVYVGLCRLPLSSKALSEHVKWVVNPFGKPLLIGIAGGAVAGAIAFSIGQARGTNFMALPVINNQPLISAAGWLGIMWGCLTFWVIATILIGRIKTLPGKPPELWQICYDARLGTGILVFLGVCLPWYYEMFTFWRLDDESKLFWFRVIIHDNFGRLATGVHTTTPGGNFTYFIEQGGYAMFPWVALVPGALSTVARFRIRGGRAADFVGVIAVIWFTVTWALIGASATKFHHYVFPMLPPLAILMGVFIDKLWVEGLEKHGMALLLGVPIFLLVGKDISGTPKNFTDLFVYNYDRPYPSFLVDRAIIGTTNLKGLWATGFTAFGVFLAFFAFARAKAAFFTTALTGIMVWALWFNWSHWVDLSHNWTQRDQFWRYYTNRKPGEPIAAFLMNWRGETFYSRNTIKQIKDNANVGMAQYAQLPGRKWALVEHNRLGILKGAVGEHPVTVIDKDLNNKFVLVTID